MEGKTIFLIDDDLSVRRGLSRILRSGGYDVRVFSSAEEFLGIFDNTLQGCIILDARMPGLSGTSLQHEFEDRGINLPVIFITADQDPRTRMRAKELGARAFLYKPIDRKELFETVSRVMSPA